MKYFHLFVKIAAFALMIYVFLQQKNDYYAEMRATPPDATQQMLEEIQKSK